jgi:hypothetical protein
MFDDVEGLNGKMKGEPDRLNARLPFRRLQEETGKIPASSLSRPVNTGLAVSLIEGESRNSYTCD